jgi:PAS domain S-box-containing protein
VNPSQPGDNGVRTATAGVFEALMDWFPDIIQSVDAEGRIVYANRKASELLGYTHAELLGMSVYDLYAPEIMEKVKAGFADLKSRGDLSINESLVLDKKGIRIPVEIRSFAVYDTEGRFLRTFSILRDLRAMKALQDQLMHSSRLAAIGELAACIVHDISNPLAVIRLYLELMQAQAGELAAASPAMASFMESVVNLQKAEGKIEKLILHLREFTRSQEAQVESVDLRGIVADALFMVTNKLDKRGVRVEKELPASPCLVTGNASQLEQVFMNLFANACDAMKTVASPVLRVSIRPVTGESGLAAGWECRVADKGEGIPEENLARIFQPFFTTKPRGEGTGLGLSITRQIVLRHTGQISVESAPGKGTTFILNFPVASGRGASAPLMTA